MMAYMKFTVVKNIIFDLGGVLLDLNFDHALKAFQQLNRDTGLDDMREFIHHPLLNGFETGDITAGEFRNRLRHLLKNQEVPNEDLDLAWCSLLGEVPESKVQLIRELSVDFNLFLFSNTNTIHIPYFRQAFSEQHSTDWEELFRMTFYSHEIGERKPNLSAYQKVISLAGIDAVHTLFVDDLEANVAAAAAAGMHALHYLPGNNLKDEIFSFLGSSGKDHRG